MILRCVQASFIYLDKLQVLQAAGGSGTPRYVAEEIRRRGISTVPLTPEDVRQLLDTLVADGTLDRMVGSAVSTSHPRPAINALFFL